VRLPAARARLLGRCSPGHRAKVHGFGQLTYGTLRGKVPTRQTLATAQTQNHLGPRGACLYAGSRPPDPSGPHGQSKHHPAAAISLRAPGYRVCISIPASAVVRLRSPWTPGAGSTHPLSCNPVRIGQRLPGKPSPHEPAPCGTWAAQGIGCPRSPQQEWRRRRKLSRVPGPYDMAMGLHWQRDHQAQGTIRTVLR